MQNDDRRLDRRWRAPAIAVLGFREYRCRDDIDRSADDDFRQLSDGTASRGSQLPPGGLEQPEVLAMLRDLANAVRIVFEPASWMMIEGGEIVGLCSLVKEPSDGSLDIVYGVSPGRRRSGLATAAVGALLCWARNDERVLRVRAETSIHNEPSQRVLERNRFERIGKRVDDEDGTLICWSADTTS